MAAGSANCCYDAGWGGNGSERNAKLSGEPDLRIPAPSACRLRLAAALAIVTAVLSCAGAAHADFLKPSTGRWCALTAVGLNDCSYDTFAQCMATLSGLGGVCSENLQAPRYVEAPPPPRKRHSKRHRKVQQ